MTEERDRATAQTLGWLALVFVAGWTVVGVLDGGVRLVDALRWRDAAARFTGWDPVVPIGAQFLLGMLWMAAVVALAVGVALGVAALVLRGRVLRGVLLAVAALAGVAVQLVGIGLSRGMGWSFWTSDGIASRLSAATGALVVPVMLLPAAWLILLPTLGTRRSTPEPAAVG